MAVSSPLLEASIDGAHGVLLSIAGGSDLGLFEVSAAANLIQGSAHEEANIIFGTVIDDALGDEVRVTVIAAGFEGGQPPRRQPGISRAADLRNHQARSTPTPLEPATAGANNSMNHATTPSESQSVAPPAAPAPLSPTPVTVPRGRIFDDELDIPDFLK
jgi:cell division protein FtsZ